ncbi:MAG: HAMP domain-containing histidine kinase [Sphingobacteriaceae bacterium]|nr:HAMP domain-containing histidine kinase [Sphingobacteriaceae bacterium]
MASELSFNLATFKWQLLAVTSLILIIHSVFYYLSRFAKKFTLAIVWYSIINNLLFCSTFFFSSGINGPTLLLYTLSFAIIILVVPRRQYIIWIPLNIIFVCSSLVLQYLKPDLFPYAYDNDNERYIHFFFTYLLVISFLYIGTSLLRRNYENERSMAIQRAEAIAVQNQKITEQNIELARLNAEKNRLFSIVAHDLRAPLDSLQGYLEIINDINLGKEEKHELEGKLIHATKNASEMIVNLLYWSKSQMEGIRADIKELNLSDTIKNTIEVQKIVSEKKHITVDYSIDAELKVCADANMLQLVLRNLIQNAIKFTPTGGCISVFVTREKHELTIFVKDSGVGIPREKQKYLFTANAKSTVGTGLERGIGLGLLLCKDFAERMDGKLVFESEVNEGSVFGIRLRSA